MPKGAQPSRKFVIPQSDQHERTNIGAAWTTSNSEVASCRLKLPFDLKAGEELSFIAVPFEPRQVQPVNENQPAPEQPKASTKRKSAQPRPAA